MDNQCSSSSIEDNDEDAGNKGFTIECQGGEKLVVSDDEAGVIFHLVEYFRNVFKHGTRESSDRLLRKLDWSLAIAKQVVAYLTLKRVEISDGDWQATIEFVEALHQILVPARAYYPVLRPLSGAHVEPQLLRNLFGILKNEGNTQFSERMKVCGIFWKVALKCGVLLLDEDSELDFGLQKGSQSETQLKRLKATMVQSRTYHVLSPLSLANAVARIAKIMHTGSLKMAEAKHMNRRGDSFSGGFGNVTAESAVRDAVKRVSDATGTKGSLYHPKKSSRKFPLFYGTFSQLKQCLDLFKDELDHGTDDGGIDDAIPEMGKISLRVAAPSSETLQKLIDALLRSNDKEHEVDFYHNSHNVRKGTEAMTQLLSFASDPQAPSSNEMLSSDSAFTLKATERHYH
ncbi:expressed unknown protein [Seminavis robusta]|uniref:Uncharacterized protein n=1 Tax=Seminavis robusta TaxID=568900 RepID=A0A9N8DZ63_9STRA|nr:expressed unknown protein [Seminavis robusta]|eukprot:Sro487_g152760.1 n/a (401) ;mRNA; r:9870-11519